MHSTTRPGLAQACRHDFSDGDTCSRCDAARSLRVEHHGLRCLCQACCDARRDEAAARKEELAGRYSAFLERTMGPVTARLGTPRKAMPGTVAAINARYGKRSA